MTVGQLCLSSEIFFHSVNTVNHIVKYTINKIQGYIKTKLIHLDWLALASYAHPKNILSALSVIGSAHLVLESL